MKFTKTFAEYIFEIKKIVSNRSISGKTKSIDWILDDPSSSKSHSSGILLNKDLKEKEVRELTPEKVNITINNLRFLKDKQKEIGELRCEYCNKGPLVVYDFNIDVKNMRSKIRHNKKFKTKNGATVDHKNPISGGGDKFNYDNLVVCCYSCNQRKKNMSYEDWIKIISIKENKNDDFYWKKISYDEYSNIISEGIFCLSFNRKDFYKIKSIVNFDNLKSIYLIKGIIYINLHGMAPIPEIQIEIIKLEDSYFLVEFKEPKKIVKRFLCDQIDGLISFLDYIKGQIYNQERDYQLDRATIKESKNNDLYCEISFEEYYDKLYKTIEFENSEFEKIKNLNIIPENWNTFKYEGRLVLITFKANYRFDIEIYKMNDEYYLINTRDSVRGIYRRYLCDQIDGLVSFINYIKE